VPPLLLARARTADAVTLYIEREFRGVKVLDYSMDFRPGSSILEQIEKAAKECACGVFLFTKDDEIAGAEAQATPRDNVIFRAGYFTRTKGKERVLIIREEGTKMPADLGGVVYISLKSREDIATIETQIRRFLDDRL
jgi:predicted nucleotide-binding protein